MRNMSRPYGTCLGIVLIAVMVLAAIPAVSAVPAHSATLTSPSDPNNVHAGDVIRIQVNNLPAGEFFKYRITSSDLQTSGNSVSLAGVNMPFAFTTGSSVTTLTTTGVTLSDNPLTVKYSGVEYTPARTAGTNTVTAHQNIKAGNYDVTMTALSKTDANTGIDYSVQGNVDGLQASSVLSFTVTGVNSGHLTVEVTGGSDTLLTQTFTITQASVVHPPSDSDSSSGGGAGGAAGGVVGGAAPQGAPQSLLAPTGISPTSVTVQHNAEGKTLADYTIATDPAAGFSSSVGVPSGTTALTSTGQPVTEISVTPLDPATVTDITAAAGGVFSFSGYSVECSPSGAQFTGGVATISFSLTPSQWSAALEKVNGNTAAMTISYYDPAAKSWVEIPTVVDPVTHTVSAQTSHFSTYALFYKATKETASGSPQTIGDLITSSPTAASGTPAPVVTTPSKAMMAPQQTTQSPGLPGIVVIAVVGFVGYVVARKNQ
jgi:hypothetical protein